MVCSKMFHDAPTGEEAADSVAMVKRMYETVISSSQGIPRFVHQPDILTTKNNLAVLLDEQGTKESVAEAKALYLEVIAGFERDLGPDHPLTQQAKTNSRICKKTQKTSDHFPSHSVSSSICVCNSNVLKFL